MFKIQNSMSRALVRREQRDTRFCCRLFFFVTFVLYPYVPVHIHQLLFDSNMGKNAVDVFVGLDNYMSFSGMSSSSAR